jgi:hypothetical protein
MNQAAQWFSSLERKHCRMADSPSTEDLQAKIMQFIAEWNEQTHPLNWSTTSVAKVMAEVRMKKVA